MKNISIDEKIRALFPDRIENKITVLFNDKSSTEDSLIVAFTGKNDWFEVPVSSINDIQPVGCVLNEGQLYTVLDIIIKKENQLFHDDLIREKFRNADGFDETGLLAGRNFFAGPADVAARELSGIQWVSRFPGKRDIDSLVSPFREELRNFYNALLTAGANVNITATFRPIERAYLMRSSYLISRELKKPEEIEDFEGVNINWVHETLDKSIAAATDMVLSYQIVHMPALNTRHSLGLAIDMNVNWSDILSIQQANGVVKSISSSPKNNTNSDLAAVARTYNVIKNPTDLPHWSDNGH